MGGFDSYAYGLWADPSEPLLADDGLDRLQSALLRGAPTWSSRAHLAAVGRWPVREAFDVALPGSLETAIRSQLPGGSKARPALGLDSWGVHDALVRLSGADRGAHVTLQINASLAGADAGGLTDWIQVETTQRTIDGMAAGEWIERLFRAICDALVPSTATAGSLGEAGGYLRRYGAKTDGLRWLTYVGPSKVGALNVEAARQVPGAECSPVAGGLLVRVDPSPGPRRGATYWRRIEALETALGRDTIRGILDRGQRLGARRSVVPSLPAPIPIRRPEVVAGAGGAPHIRGTRYAGVRFTDLDYRMPGALIEGFDLERCEFDNVSLGSVVNDLIPITVRDCRLTRCRFRAAILRLLLVEDCVIDGATGSVWPTASVLLRHVVVRGPVDSLDLRSPRQLRLDGHPSLIALHDAHYRTVDWALDIREARFRRCDLGGVPGRLVRRDPQTQILVTRARVLATPWLDLTPDTVWKGALERLLERGDESEVLVACQRGERFSDQVAGFARLREAGVAEPD